MMTKNKNCKLKNDVEKEQMSQTKKNKCLKQKMF